jgi:uncharacterized protein YoxC
MSRKIVSSILAALQAATIFVFLGNVAPALAETLNTYYKVLIAVRKCELSVDETQLARLQEIIENRVTDTDASSDTINAIFDQIAAEIGNDTPTFCTAYSDTALSILASL